MCSTSPWSDVINMAANVQVCDLVEIYGTNTGKQKENHKKTCLLTEWSLYFGWDSKSRETLKLNDFKISFIKMCIFSLPFNKNNICTECLSVSLPPSRADTVLQIEV